MIQRKRITIIGIIIVGGIIITGVLALNGYFGGGAKIPEDTFTRGLVAYWSFDEGAGDIAYDISGNGNNCTIYGAKWTKGKYGSALQFDGVDDYVDCGSQASLIFANSDSYSFEHWIKWTGGGSYVLYAGKNSAEEAFLLRAEDNNRFGFRDSGASQPLFAPNSSDDCLNVWVHLVWVADGLGNIELYKNGTYFDSVTPPNGTSMHFETFGRSWPFNVYMYEGLIDEVRIYNRALSPEEIRYHYNRGRPVAHWRFDEGSGTTTYDSSGNEYHGILHE